MRMVDTMTVTQAARILCVTPETVRRMAHRGILTWRSDERVSAASVQVALELQDTQGCDTTEDLRMALVQSRVKIEALERKIDLLGDLLGFRASEVPCDPEDARRMHRRIQEEVLVDDVCPSCDVIMQWSRVVLDMTPAYFTLLNRATQAARPWQPFVRFFEHVHETAPSVHRMNGAGPDVLLAHSYANCARRHLNRIVYNHLTEHHGPQVAHRAVPTPERLSDRLDTYMMGMRADPIQQHLGAAAPVDRFDDSSKRPHRVPPVPPGTPRATKRRPARLLPGRRPAEELLAELDRDEAGDPDDEAR